MCVKWNAPNVISSKKQSFYVFTSKKGWDDEVYKHNKTYENLYLPIATKQLLQTDIENFINNRAFWDRLGIKYQRGYLFYGAPGTGKTSIIKVWSKMYNLDVYDLRLETIDSDEELIKRINAIKCGRLHIIIMEDIDCIQVTHQRNATREDEVVTQRIESGLETLSNTDSGTIEVISKENK